MKRVFAIGSAPSSGSTFFADLIDSTPYSACGPELNLFSLPCLYTFGRFQKSVHCHSRISSIYLGRPSLVFNDLCTYGLDEERLKRMAAEAEGFSEFIEKFRRYYLALRGKHQKAVLFEKTPQNISRVGAYLDQLERPFVHIVRNPAYVYASLLRRGLPEGIALVTWLTEVAAIFPYLDHPNVITIKYESLVERPFETVAALLKRIGDIDVEPEAVEAGYVNNDYRKRHAGRVSSWTQKKVGEVRNANAKPLESRIIERLAELPSLKVSGRYAACFSLPEVTFSQLLSKLDYEEEFYRLVGDTSSRDFVWDQMSRKRLLKKFLSDLKYGDASLREFDAYLNPVEQI